MRMSALPVDVLIHLFSYFTFKERLTTIARVCTRWQEICQASVFWRELTIQDMDWSRNMTFPIVQEAFKQHANHLLRLTLYGVSGMDLFDFTEIQLLYLKTIHVHSDVDFPTKSLVRACPSVEEIAIYHYLCRIPGSTFAPLGEWIYLKRVTLICEMKCVDQPDKILTMLARACIRLERVNINFGSYQQLSDVSVLELFKYHHRTLTHLSLTAWNGKTLVPIIACQELSHLELHSCHNIIDEELVAMGRLSKLVHLTLCDFKAGPSALALALMNCVTLTHVMLFAMPITAEVTSHLATSCTNLQSLQLGGVRPVTDELVRPLLRAKQLKYLSFLWTHDITKEVLHEIPNQLPQLRGLQLGDGPTYAMEEMMPIVKLNAEPDRSWFGGHNCSFIIAISLYT